jgi:toluene monooxygenase system protein A
LRINGTRTPPCSACAALSKPRLFDDLDPGWVQLVKYQNGAVALVEYAGAVAELRMARFGRDSAWRTMATLGAG